MGLDDVAVFVRVVEAGSLTLAARQLRVSKSTLSRALTRIEDKNGVRLLGRSARALVLTDAGRAFFERAAPHVTALREATSTLADQDDEDLRGTLRMTAPVDLGDTVLGELLVQFTKRHPHVRFELDLSNRVASFSEEAFDVAIRASSRLRGESLVARKIGRVDLHFFAAPAYVARSGSPREVGDLARSDWVMLRMEAHQPMHAVSSADRSDLPMSGRIDSNEFLFVRAALRAGGGIGLLPPFVAAADVVAGKLVRVLPDWSVPWGALYVVYPAARHLPRRTTVFCDFLISQLRRWNFVL